MQERRPGANAIANRGQPSPEGRGRDRPPPRKRGRVREGAGLPSLHPQGASPPRAAAKLLALARREGLRGGLEPLPQEKRKTWA